MTVRAHYTLTFWEEIESEKEGRRYRGCCVTWAIGSADALPIST